MLKGSRAYGGQEGVNLPQLRKIIFDMHIVAFFSVLPPVIFFLPLMRERVRENLFRACSVLMLRPFACADEIVAGTCGKGPSWPH